MNRTLTKGTRYEMEDVYLHHEGWRSEDPDESFDGLDLGEYFAGDGTYRGADMYGTEPTFAAEPMPGRTRRWCVYISGVMAGEYEAIFSDTAAARYSAAHGGSATSAWTLEADLRRTDPHAWVRVVDVTLAGGVA